MTSVPFFFLCHLLTTFTVMCAESSFWGTKRKYSFECCFVCVNGRRMCGCVSCRVCVRAQKKTCICTHYLFGNMHWSVHMHWRSMAVNKEERTLFRVFFVCFSCWPHQRWSLSISFGSGITYKMVHINGNCLAVIKRYDSMGFVVVCVCGASVLLFTGCDRHRGHRHHPQHSTARRA